MTGFSADWLAEREAADARARSADLVGTLPGRFESIVDLGAGTGSNLRWLAPKLDSPQRWVLVDNDKRLLVAARKSLRMWAHQRGYKARGRGNDLSMTGPGFDCTVTTLRLDLADSLSELDLPTGCLVTASALFDLVSRPWLAGLIARIERSGASILWTMTYDGRVTIDPANAFDDAVIGLVNRHQLTDKGFGPALGPDAWLVAQSLLEQAGLDVRAIDSSWQCGSKDKALVATLIDDWAAAATGIAPADARSIEKWRKARAGQAARGRLRLSVGHRDLVGRPRQSSVDSR